MAGLPGWQPRHRIRWNVVDSRSPGFSAKPIRLVAIDS